MGGGLVSHDIRHHAHLDQLRFDLGAVADQSDRKGLFGGLGFLDPFQSLLQTVSFAVNIPVVDAFIDTGLIHLDTQHNRSGHGGRQGLSAAHAAIAAGQDKSAVQIAAEMFLAAGYEGFIGALQNTLRSDINPRSGRHLPEHNQAQFFQFAEFFPGSPVRYQMRIGDQHAWAVFECSENTDRFAGLNQQSFIIIQVFQTAHDGMVAIPVAGGLAGTAVNYQLFRFFGYLGIEIVFQHTHSRLAMPVLAGQIGTPVSGNRNIFISH